MKCQNITLSNFGWSIPVSFFQIYTSDEWTYRPGPVYNKLCAGTHIHWQNQSFEEKDFPQNALNVQLNTHTNNGYLQCNNDQGSPHTTVGVIIGSHSVHSQE